MMSKRIFHLRFFFTTALVSWMAMMVFTQLMAFANANQMEHGLKEYLPELFYALFFLSIYSFYKVQLGRSRDANLQELLWKVFVSGLIATIASLILKFIEDLFLSHSRIGENPLLTNLIYNINIGLLSAFFVSTFIVWEKFIFYQKTKKLILGWRIYVYTLLATLLISLIFSIVNFVLSQMFLFIILALFLLASFYFSANLKWVAYLNYKQKWKSILLFLLILIYIGYFFNYLWGVQMQQPEALVFNGMWNLTIMGFFIFIFIYTFISILVILFNLPTSSVFEKKLEEIISFQRLSQSRNAGKNEREVYQILLESSVSAVLADAAWVESKSGNNQDPLIIKYKIGNDEVKLITEIISKSKEKQIVNSDPITNLKTDRYITSIKNNRFKSVLIFPVYIQHEIIGSLILLKEISDGFNEEMITVIRTFVNQAAISIENFKLIETILENERYIKELNIAKNVQRSLLPSTMDHSSFFDISAYSKSADEVGGDYYDIYKVDDNRTVVIIGDVSGKGTSAAFHMSQLKGIFHSLVQLDLSSHEFMVYANNALAKGLDKNSFITASIYIIDKNSRTIEFCRAGHCPTLFFPKNAEKPEYYFGKGLGLGILRNNEFQEYVNNDKIQFKDGDLLVLFTDGITEARNRLGEEFGYDRLKELVFKNAIKNPEEIKNDIINALYEYCGTKSPHDDYTVIIIKFKEKI
ncbi:MAG: SpoIIE family protein phosphatase [Cyclobacteriaceae bacterium]|nr:SpoIIE family protein phosphatase [Cyclobacteriaceae bacterium]